MKSVLVDGHDRLEELDAVGLGALEAVAADDGAEAAAGVEVADLF